MKKIVITFIFVGIFGVGFAQLNGGIKAGLNLANFGGDVENTEMLTGFHVGGYLTFSIADKINLNPELLYNAVGSKYSFSDFDPDLGEYDVEGSYKLSYLSIPVMFSYSISENFSIQAGPQLGILLSATDDFKVSGDGFSESFDEDIKDSLKSTDFGVNFGIGLNFGKLNAAARYSLGLSSIDDGAGDVKNNVIQLSVGYTLFGN